MKQTITWKNYPALTISFLSTVALTTSILTVNAVEPLASKSLIVKKTLASPTEFEIAQRSDSCYQVIAKSGLYVREEPTVYSSAVGIIAYGRNIEVAGGITNNWVPISAPLKGFVYADWIGRCQAASPPPSNCRQVITEGGIPARQKPSSESEIIGYISSGRRVILTGQGTNGWVPISVPFKGYVSSDQLVYCRNFPS
ncbi:SH3 domain-containing protein [Gloeocapsopsis crepidinum LEGE 06123]|uniref:SH3 domain-containing protein n=1 Tax=Gloeocapsopsis crepidinum LEGE 06123 TaxID=588587 RepID=A0ABR9UU97_9CHRO|nr:SH3 domain-containing protein [Gloeocapsopsis crepidinum]MBE9191881.1 SH3 domain-containing protein [Gloeocapsopsis crepidinum LEGE 06123]